MLPMNVVFDVCILCFPSIFPVSARSLSPPFLIKWPGTAPLFFGSWTSEALTNCFHWTPLLVPCSSMKFQASYVRTTSLLLLTSFQGIMLMSNYHCHVWTREWHSSSWPWASKVVEMGSTLCCKFARKLLLFGQFTFKISARRHYCHLT